MPWVPRRSSGALLALVLACMLLVGSGTALAAGSNGSSGSSGGGSSGGQSVTPPSSGGGPLSGGLSTPGTPTPTATATQTQTQATSANTATNGGGSLSQTSVFGIVIGSVIVIGGVCVYIFRDASRRAPSRRRADGGSATQARVPGSKRVKPRKLSTQERKRRKRGRAPRRK